MFRLPKQIEMVLLLEHTVQKADDQQYGILHIFKSKYLIDNTVEALYYGHPWDQKTCP